METYYYLGLMLFTISYPLAQSFEHRIQYHRQWFALFPAIGIMAAVFVVWDHWFTVQGVWGFNDRYLLGIYIWELPIEEWAFFIFVPFACMFIYEVLIYFVKKDIFKSSANFIQLSLAGLLFIGGIIFWDRMYTGVNFIFAASVLVVHFLIFKNRHFGRFFMAYLVSWLPFLLVNGVLTGSWIDEPIVWYNDAENLGIRIGTIPVEDSVYNLGMLLMVTTVYEKIRAGKTIKR